MFDRLAIFRVPKIYSEKRPLFVYPSFRKSKNLQITEQVLNLKLEQCKFIEKGRYCTKKHNGKSSFCEEHNKITRLIGTHPLDT